MSTAAPDQPPARVLAFTLRLPAPLAEDYRERAWRARVPLGRYLVDVLANTPPPPAPLGIKPGGQLSAALEQLRGVAGNLNQLTKYIHTHGTEHPSVAVHLPATIAVLEERVRTLALTIKLTGEAP